MLEIKAEVMALARVRAWVETLAREAGLSREAETDLLAAVDEAAANVIEHGYLGKTPGPLRLAAFLEPGEVRVRIEDEGAPFDPSRGGGPLDLDWRAPWNLIRRCVHSLIYERLAGGTNRLTPRLQGGSGRPRRRMIEW
jgi:anti-sigma regulatory factor (Ser/Thr protein kinase)